MAFNSNTRDAAGLFREKQGMSAEVLKREVLKYEGVEIKLFIPNLKHLCTPCTLHAWIFPME
jgi:hypothetical protein